MDFRIMEAGREADRTRSDEACWLADEDVGKRRRAPRAVLAIVGGAHEKAQVALERSGLREGGLDGGVFSAAVVHAVAQAQHRPVVMSVSDGEAEARPPVVAEAGQVRRKRRLGIGLRCAG